MACDNLSKEDLLRDLFKPEKSEVPERKLRVLRDKPAEQNPYGVEHNQYANYIKKIRESKYFLFTPGNIYTHFVVTSKDNLGMNHAKPDRLKSLQVIKSALKERTAQDLILIIDFLFISEQETFNKKSLAPSILNSLAVHGILQDAILWKNGAYSPKKARLKKGDYELIPETFNGVSKIRIGEW